MSDLCRLEIRSRPNLERYQLRPSIYEKEEKKIEMSFAEESRYINTNMAASTASQENYCK